MWAVGGSLAAPGALDEGPVVGGFAAVGSGFLTFFDALGMKWKGRSGRGVCFGFSGAVAVLAIFGHLSMAGEEGVDSLGKGHWRFAVGTEGGYEGNVLSVWRMNK